MAVLVVCSEPWQSDPSGFPVCPGTLLQQPAPVSWSMDSAEVGDVLTAVLLLFCVAAAVRFVVRFVVSQVSGRG